MITIKTILKEVNQVKQCGRAQLYIYLAQCGIKPIGARQRPAIYPADTTMRILAHLGISEAPAVARRRKKPAFRRLLTLPQLKAARPQRAAVAAVKGGRK